MIILKHFAKDCFVMRHAELLRMTYAHPDVLAHLLTDKKMTASENERWYEEEYSRDTNHNIYFAHVDNTEKCVGIIDVRTESLQNGIASITVNPVAQYVDDMKLYIALTRIIRKELFETGIDDGFMYRKLIARILARDGDRVAAVRELGFAREGLLKAHVRKGAVFHNVYQMFSLNSDPVSWPA